MKSTAHRRSLLSGVRPAAALAVIALSGCGGIPWLGGDEDPTPPTPLAKIEPEIALRELWRQDVGRGTDEKRLHLVPAFTGGRIFTADARGQVTAMAAEDGRVIWERDLELPLSGGPAATGDRLVVGSTKGDLIALSVQDGSELWRARTESEILSVPQLSEGLVVVHTLDDSVYAFAADSGEQRWRFTHQAPVLILRGSSTPALLPDGAIVGLTGGLLVKLGLDEGIPLWTVRITPPMGRSELERITDIDADPVVVGDTAYIGTYNGDLAAVDRQSGAVLWRRTLSVYAGLAADDDSLYITDAQDHVWAADQATGAGRWQQEGLAYRHLSAPALYGDLVLVGDLDGYLHGLARADGHLAARARVGKDPISARPVVRDGRVYVLADDGTLTAWTRRHGAIGRTAGADTADGGATSAAVEDARRAP